jgi:hypothetical protein
LARLERLSPGVTFPGSPRQPSRQFLEIEQTGMTTSDLARRSGRLRHLENLIADWRVDGETIFVTELDEDCDSYFYPTGGFTDIPDSVSYVSFESTRLLNLTRIPRTRIEGVYTRGVASNGQYSVELTFVCQEPGWTTMDSCLYADALEVGSRISVGIIPLEMQAPGYTQGSFEGDHLLSGDPALGHAINAITIFFASGLWRTTAARYTSGPPPA